MKRSKHDQQAFEETIEKIRIAVKYGNDLEGIHQANVLLYYHEIKPKAYFAICEWVWREKAKFVPWW